MTTDPNTETCTAHIVNEHSGGTHHCVLNAGHRDPDFGTDHAGPVDDEGGRYRWSDHAIGAVPHHSPTAPAGLGVSATPSHTGQAAAALAEDLRYLLNYRGPGHDHERPGVWDTSGMLCGHCARLEVARRNLTAYDAGRPAVPPPADRAAVLREAADVYDQLLKDMGADVSKDPRYWTGVQHVVTGLRRLADDAQEQEPEAETGTLYPARHTWTFEVCYDPDRDKWHGCGPTYDDSVFDNAHETAQEDFQHRAENDKQRRRFRMIRATTAYTVEAEHQSAVEARQDGAQS